jgi:NitT/TauT family transport system substrate-binding protein
MVIRAGTSATPARRTPGRGIQRRGLAALILGVVLAAGMSANLAQASTLQTPTERPTVGPPSLSTAPVVRLGFFANLTHAPALVAQDLRLFQTMLGKDGTKIEFVLFNAGPAAVEAMKGGAIDVAYIGPTPAVSGYATTHGTLLRVVSGVTSGGAQLVVRPSITKVADFRGKKFTTPQLGNTQDVAFRSWLKGKGLNTTINGGGDVSIYSTENSTSLSLFKKGQIDGAWLPEPWASRLVLEAGAKVFLDEKSLWPRGEFVTTNIVAAQGFLAKFPGTVRSILQANNAAIAYIERNPKRATAIVQGEIAKWTGRPLPPAVVERAWDNLNFTWDPLPDSLKKDAADAVSVGLLTLGPGQIDGIVDLRLLNSVLRSAHEATVSSAGLGFD